MRKSKLIVAVIIFILSVSLFSLNRFFKRHYAVPIIMYHYFDPKSLSTDKLNVKPASFERQARFLKTHNYNVVPLERIARMIRDNEKIPPKTIAITMDDGYKNNYTHAFPILKKYALPATIFLIVNEIDRPQNDRLGWNEIKEMQDSGLVTFGSHTLGPEPLINIKSEAELKRQIFDSKMVLEERLGRKVSTFSYPEGFFDDKIRKLVTEAGYDLAVAVMPGKSYPGNDVFALKRLMISPSSDNLFIFWFETSGIYTYLKECSRERKRKHKLALKQ